MTNNIVFKSQGEGWPFHFQHGLGSNLHQPQGLLADLQGVRLISMDCPGHGKAALAAGTRPSFKLYAQRVIQLMDQLGVEKAIFGGISMGAGISSYMALHHPDRVQALVLVRPAWLDEGHPANLGVLVEAAEYIGQENGQERFQAVPAFQAIQAAVPNAAQSVLGVFAASQRPEIPTVLKAMVADRPFEDIQSLRKITVPALVIGNEDDPLHPYDMAVQMAQHLPNSTLEKVVSRYINDTTHRQVVYQIVSKFIDNL